MPPEIIGVAFHIRRQNSIGVSHLYSGRRCSQKLGAAAGSDNDQQSSEGLPPRSNHFRSVNLSFFMDCCTTKQGQSTCGFFHGSCGPRFLVGFLIVLVGLAALGFSGTFRDLWAVYEFTAWQARFGAWFVGAGTAAGSLAFTSGHFKVSFDGGRIVRDRPGFR